MENNKDNICIAILLRMGLDLTQNENLLKPMALLLGKPVLEHQELCKKYGFTNIALLVHYEHEAISNYFKDGTMGVVISYIIEKEPRGTAGALFDALGLTEYFLVLYGDTYIDVNLRSIIDFHNEKESDITLMIHQMTIQMIQI